MCSFLVPRLSLVTYLSFVAHSLQATAEGHFLTTIHCSSTSTRHSAKDKQLQSERSPCLSSSSVFCQQETIKELFRDRTSPTILINWHFSMFICQNHWDCAILMSVLKSLQLNYGFLTADGGELSKPSKPHHNFKTESFTRRQNEGRDLVKLNSFASHIPDSSGFKKAPSKKLPAAVSPYTLRLNSTVLAMFPPGFLCTSLSAEHEKLKTPWLRVSTSWQQLKHHHVINITVILNPKYSTVLGTRKKITLISAETRTVSTPYSIPFMSCSSPTLSNTPSPFLCFAIYTEVLPQGTCELDFWICRWLHIDQVTINHL